MHSIVPGWYSGRSAHFHIKAYTEGNGSIADNGTFIAGSSVQYVVVCSSGCPSTNSRVIVDSTGQFFFADSFMETVGNLTPYNANTVERLANADDMWFAFENASIRVLCPGT